MPARTTTTTSPNRTLPKPLTCAISLLCEGDGRILGPDRGETVKAGRILDEGSGGLDDDAGEPVLAWEAVGLGFAVARPDERAIRVEELRVPGPVRGGVGVRRGNAHSAKLGVVLQHLREGVAAASQLEDVPNREARAIAEGLAVHHEWIRDDPLDRHWLRRPCR